MDLLKYNSNKFKLSIESLNATLVVNSDNDNRLEIHIVSYTLKDEFTGEIEDILLTDYKTGEKYSDSKEVFSFTLDQAENLFSAKDFEMEWHHIDTVFHWNEISNEAIIAEWMLIKESTKSVTNREQFNIISDKHLDYQISSQYIGLNYFDEEINLKKSIVIGNNRVRRDVQNNLDYIELKNIILVVNFQSNLIQDVKMIDFIENLDSNCELIDHNDLDVEMQPYRYIIDSESDLEHAENFIGWRMLGFFWRHTQSRHGKLILESKTLEKHHSPLVQILSDDPERMIEYKYYKSSKSNLVFKCLSDSNTIIEIRTAEQ